MIAFRCFMKVSVHQGEGNIWEQIFKLDAVTFNSLKQIATALWLPNI